MFSSYINYICDISGVVEFLSSGQVSMDHHDFKGHGYKKSLHKLAVITKNHAQSSNSNMYTHSFRLRAAYKTDTMPYTNYTFDFKGIIDYIFHNSETMTTLATLGPIAAEWFKNNKVVGCPHPHVPSGEFCSHYLNPLIPSYLDFQRKFLE